MNDVEDKPKSYEERKAEIKEQQSQMSYDDIKKQMASNSEFMAELDNLPKQNHIWIDRGLKMTCEDAGHPWHEAYKKRRKNVI